MSHIDRSKSSTHTRGKNTIVCESSSFFVSEMATAPSQRTTTPARNALIYEISMASEQQPKSLTKSCTDPHNIHKKKCHHEAIFWSSQMSKVLMLRLLIPSFAKARGRTYGEVSGQTSKSTRSRIASINLPIHSWSARVIWCRIGSPVTVLQWS